MFGKYPILRVLLCPFSVWENAGVGIKAVTSVTAMTAAKMA
jgi:hypothetical protein